MHIFANYNSIEMKIIRLLAALAALSLAFVSCKKDGDDGDTSLFFSKSARLSESLPLFTKAGDTFTFSASGAERASEDLSTATIGYCFYTSFSTKRDTIRYEGGDWLKTSYTVTIPSDTLCKLTVTASAFAKGYYNSAASTSTTIVDPAEDGTGSLTGFVNYGSDSELTDTRDMKKYPVTEVGGLLWMRRNLAWGDGGACGRAYCDCDVMSGILGRFYTADEAASACPAGWRLPSSAECDELLKLCDTVGDLKADVSFNGVKMWAYWPECATTDVLRISLIPSGYAETGGGTNLYKGFGSYAIFWTSDTDESGNAVARYLFDRNNKLYAGGYSRTDFAASVRCVK